MDTNKFISYLTELEEKGLSTQEYNDLMNVYTKLYNMLNNIRKAQEKALYLKHKEEQRLKEQRIKDLREQLKQELQEK